MAAHAVAEHLIQSTYKTGCLVGYYKQSHKGSWTPLDIPLENAISTYHKKPS